MYYNYFDLLVIVRGHRNVKCATTTIAVFHSFCVHHAPQTFKLIIPIVN